MALEETVIYDGGLKGDANLLSKIEPTPTVRENLPPLITNFIDRSSFVFSTDVVDMVDDVFGELIKSHLHLLMPLVEAFMIGRETSFDTLKLMVIQLNILMKEGRMHEVDEYFEKYDFFDLELFCEDKKLQPNETIPEEIVTHLKRVFDHNLEQAKTVKNGDDLPLIVFEQQYGLPLSDFDPQDVVNRIKHSGVLSRALWECYQKEGSIPQSFLDQQEEIFTILNGRKAEERLSAEYCFHMPEELNKTVNSGEIIEFLTPISLCHFLLKDKSYFEEYCELFDRYPFLRRDASRYRSLEYSSLAILFIYAKANGQEDFFEKAIERVMATCPKEIPRENDFFKDEADKKLSIHDFSNWGDYLMIYFELLKKEESENFDDEFEALWEEKFLPLEKKFRSNNHLFGILPFFIKGMESSSVSEILSFFKKHDINNLIHVFGVHELEHKKNYDANLPKKFQEEIVNNKGSINNLKSDNMTDILPSKEELDELIGDQQRLSVYFKNPSRQLLTSFVRATEEAREKFLEQLDFIFEFYKDHDSALIADIFKKEKKEELRENLIKNSSQTSLKIKERISSIGLKDESKGVFDICWECFTRPEREQKAILNGLELLLPFFQEIKQFNVLFLFRCMKYSKEEVGEFIEQYMTNKEHLPLHDDKFWPGFLALSPENRMKIVSCISEENKDMLHKETIDLENPFTELLISISIDEVAEAVHNALEKVKAKEEEIPEIPDVFKTEKTIRVRKNINVELTNEEEDISVKLSKAINEVIANEDHLKSGFIAHLEKTIKFMEKNKQNGKDSYFAFSEALAHLKTSLRESDFIFVCTEILSNIPKTALPRINIFLIKKVFSKNPALRGYFKENRIDNVDKSIYFSTFAELIIEMKNEAEQFADAIASMSLCERTSEEVKVDLWQGVDDYMKSSFIDEYIARKQRFDSEESIKEFSILGRKNEIDVFYGKDTCINDHDGEIYSEEFIPLRMLNKEMTELEGYIWLLEGESEEYGKVLVLSEIHPVRKIRGKFNAKDMYDGVLQSITEYAQESGKYNAIFQTTNDNAISNDTGLKRHIKERITDLPDANLKEERKFPQTSNTDISKCKLLKRIKPAIIEHPQARNLNNTTQNFNRRIQSI